MTVLMMPLADKYFKSMISNAHAHSVVRWEGWGEYERTVRFQSRSLTLCTYFLRYCCLYHEPAS